MGRSAGETLVDLMNSDYWWLVDVSVQLRAQLTCGRSNNSVVILRGF